jgi:hypothetical protein
MIKIGIIMGLLGTFLNTACSYFSGLGYPVDKSKSVHFYYNPSKTKIIYCKGGNWFELGETDMEADAKSFKVLNGFIGVDKDFVFYTWSKQPNINAHELYVDGEGIIKDNNNVYYGGYQNLIATEVPDPKKFHKANPQNGYYNSFYKDEQYYYHGYNRLDVDYNSFEVINKSFAKDKNRVYLIDDFNSKNITIDPNDVQIINEFYIKDKHFVYYQGDEEPLTVGINNFNDLKILEYSVIIVDGKVITEGKLFKYKNVDAKTFESISYPLYTKDKNHVYYKQEIFDKADAATFQEVGDGYYKDKHYVFYYDELLPEADSGTFYKADKHGFVYKDKKGHAYKHGFLIK